MTRSGFLESKLDEVSLGEASNVENTNPSCKKYFAALPGEGEHAMDARCGTTRSRAQAAGAAATTPSCLLRAHASPPPRDEGPPPPPSRARKAPCADRPGRPGLKRRLPGRRRSERVPWRSYDSVISFGGDFSTGGGEDSIGEDSALGSLSNSFGARPGAPNLVRSSCRDS